MRKIFICDYCGEYEWIEHMNLLTENDEEKKMCRKCAENIKEHYENRIVSKAD